MKMNTAARARRGFIGLLTAGVLVASSSLAGAWAAGQAGSGSDGPGQAGPKLPAPKMGNAARGKAIFRFETFGNEGFWTDAVRLPAGIKAAKVTPMQAMKLGISVDVDALDAATVATLKQQLQQDPSGNSSAVLNDPKTIDKLVKANAVIGMPPKGNKVGATCALCHTITDGSLFSMANGGSIGHREDGLTNHNLNLGAIFATAENSRALYPMLQLTLHANGDKTFGRAPTGLTENSSEADVDAYLNSAKDYPVGMFDDSPDGNGDQMQIQPLFRQDLAAPFGSFGSINRLDNFSNLVYTGLLDPTNFTTPGGRAFLHILGGAAGDEIADNYVKVLKATGVKGYPFARAPRHGKPGSEDAPLGTRVNEQKLDDLNAYLASLPAPAGAQVDAQAAAHGRELFRTVSCTGCHNVDQGQPQPTFLVPMKQIFPGYNPTVLAQRKPPLDPVAHTPGSTFDLKAAITNATIRGDIRGSALPLLLDLARQPFFLHDDSVPSLDNLLDPTRGPQAPHPFYVPDGKDRHDVVEFLKSLDTGKQAAK
ncbi:MAG: hypothetical protein ABI383_01930 [Acidobacteriaceae bacterium]